MNHTPPRDPARKLSKRLADAFSGVARKNRAEARIAAMDDAMSNAKNGASSRSGSKDQFRDDSGQRQTIPDAKAEHLKHLEALRAESSSGDSPVYA